MSLEDGGIDPLTKFICACPFDFSCMAWEFSRRYAFDDKSEALFYRDGLEFYLVFRVSMPS